MSHIVHFHDLEVKDEFTTGGNKYVKSSTRTATIVEPKNLKGKTIYFGRDDMVSTV